MSAPLSAPVASQRIAEVMAGRILAGQLPPGARIKQDRLAEEFDASRIPVREALRILESRGLVTLRANAGAWVSEMDLHDLDVSYRIREQIEPMLLVESMSAVTEADVRHMVELEEEIEANSDVERFLVLDRQLHWAAYAHHHSPQLAAIIERLWDTTQHYRRAFTRLAVRQRSWVIFSEHRLLIEALSARDADTAAAVLAMHISRTRLELSTHPELFVGATPPDSERGRSDPDG